ncbi:Target of EGR1, member 1 (Nuclear) [Entophlyctis sp. JEL0112]|nr:Target of EGR1, member 1 (Nuclear) [Entophlyctis sp. JEL0112]
MAAAKKQQQIERLQEIERDIKNIMQVLLRFASHLGLSNIKSSLASCIALETSLAEVLNDIACCGDLKDETRWERALKNRDSAKIMQGYLAQFGYTPEGDFNFQEPGATDMKTTPKKCTSANVIEMTPGTNLSGIHMVGGLVGSNDFEESDTSFAVSNFECKSDSLAEVDTFLLRNDSEEPPSPTLESLGISSLSLGLLNSCKQSTVNVNSHECTPITQNRLISALKYASSDKSSPNMPEITPTPLHHHISDPNSIFGDLIRLVKAEEYAQLPNFLSAQITNEFLNEMIGEINEYITDKRFRDVEEDSENCESLTLEELMKVACADSAKLKAVLVALLHLGRVTSHDDKHGVKRYLTEFTGLGGPSTRATDLRERYSALRDVAMGHSLLALGMVVFTADRTKSEEPVKYTAQAFDFLLLSMVSHSVSPTSLAFLVDHGFDFNAQIRNGVPFKPGNDDADAMVPGTPNTIMRELLLLILEAKVPVVVHNGLLDLMFIYQSFYADLPAELDQFVVDVADMFAGGLLDTKYIADYVTHENASFLSYLYRKYERQNTPDGVVSLVLCPKIEASNRMPAEMMLPNGKISATRSLSLLSKLPNSVSLKPAKSRSGKRNNAQIWCFQYASHGYCRNGPACEKSHDLDVILDAEEAARAKTKKGKAFQETPIATTTVHSPADSCKQFVQNQTDAVVEDFSPTRLPIPIVPEVLETYHSACFDAFMTGFTLCSQMKMHGATKDSSQEIAEFVKEHGNRLYLMGKNVPLIIQGSMFAKKSTAHMAKRHAFRRE